MNVVHVLYWIIVFIVINNSFFDVMCFSVCMLCHIEKSPIHVYIGVYVMIYYFEISFTVMQSRDATFVYKYQDKLYLYMLIQVYIHVFLYV